MIGSYRLLALSPITVTTNLTWAINRNMHSVTPNAYMEYVDIYLCTYFSDFLLRSGATG